MQRRSKSISRAMTSGRISGQVRRRARRETGSRCRRHRQAGGVPPRRRRIQRRDRRRPQSRGRARLARAPSAHRSDVHRRTQTVRRGVCHRSDCEFEPYATVVDHEAQGPPRQVLTRAARPLPIWVGAGYVAVAYWLMPAYWTHYVGRHPALEDTPTSPVLARACPAIPSTWR